MTNPKEIPVMKVLKEISDSAPPELKSAHATTLACRQSRKLFSRIKPLVSEVTDKCHNFEAYPEQSKMWLDNHVEELRDLFANIIGELVRFGYFYAASNLIEELQSITDLPPVFAMDEDAYDGVVNIPIQLCDDLDAIQEAAVEHGVIVMRNSLTS